VSTTKAPTTVAIFNSNEDIIELLRMFLEQQGYAVVHGHVADIRHGMLDLPDFVLQHDPRLIIYDIVPPYDRSWTFLEHLRASEPLKGRPFVLTSTNAAKVREIVQPSEQIHEIVGKPFDLEEILDAVKRAAR
jgi:DNA-binding response OmpR family regulator